MDERPYFSVITPSFNQGAWIGGCVESVLAQGTRDFEHLVFDNCSTDETLAVLQRYPHLRVVSEPDRGQGHAVNKGLASARGEVICWLNADDEYPPGTFEIVRREMSAPGVEVIFGDAREIYFDGQAGGIKGAYFRGQREDFLFWWQKRQELLQPAVFFKRAVYEKIGPVREDLYIILDTEYWWRMAEHFRFHRVEAVLAIQQRQPDSKTLRQAHKIYLEKQRIFEPLLHAAYPALRGRHVSSRRRRMAWRWLDLARALAKSDRALARQCLRRSVGEIPLMALSPSWWRQVLRIGWR